MRLTSGVPILTVLVAASVGAAQTPAPEPDGSAPAWRKVEEAKASPAKPEGLVIAPGTHIPLMLINGVSTKHSVEGDRLYLQTVYLIVIQNRIVIPAGSYVEGTLTEIKQPGRLKGRGEIYLRFDSLTLPNGVTRDFRARIGGLEAGTPETLDKTEGKVEGPSQGTATTIAATTAGGAAVGAIAGEVAGRPGLGIGTGAAVGAATGLMMVLLNGRPEAIIARGTVVEMVLDRPLTYDERELDFSHAAPPLPVSSAAPPGLQPRRWPL